ncbi:NADPH-dependent FMN reductase [Flavitalea flava]
MTNKKHILAISGSLSRSSVNYRLIRALAALYSDQLEIVLFEGVGGLPPFNPEDNDDDNEKVARPVAEFRRKIRNADGVLICTPEYAHGVPGSLKNAIDWTVSTSEFSHKPTVLITASTDGRFAHPALLDILTVIEAEDIGQLNLLIQFARTKISEDNVITDDKTLVELKTLMGRFISKLNSL